MQIKNYLQMSAQELDQLLVFENRNKQSKQSFSQMDKEFRSDEFDYGKGVLIKTGEHEVLGRVLMVLKECDKKGIGYVTRLDINEQAADMESIALELVEAGKCLAAQNGARRIVFGARVPEITGIMDALGMKSQYALVLMSLGERNRRGNILELIPLSQQNRNQYLEIYNDSFREVPNGATLTEQDLDGYINDDDADKFYYIAKSNDEMIGFLQLDIENCIGEFDLGLSATARGKGYGKQLLETAIDRLNEEKAEEIRLIAASSNTVAYDMYRKRGFNVVRTLSQWYVLQDEN